ncbi:MAG: tetratricopeptide repeat protein [Treponema sp.]|jgi:tetratricopeptide (TPR) repeat protein|nr:tetratricopeptide repeat protein [Treponema sp.]
MKLFFLPLILFALFSVSGCLSRGAASAEEYYSIGMAYFELGKWEEAEKWLSRARFIDKTKNASEYNLGRIDFELGRYQDAAKKFEAILKKDPQNVMALKAAAFARLKNEEFDKAEAHYKKLLVMVPESADDGYNYALLLYASKKYPEAEEVLFRYEFALKDSADSLLLLARTQRKQNKVEAADNYDKWLANNSDPKVSYEYGQVLEEAGFFARAIEQYRETLNSLSQDSEDPKRSDLRFTIAKLFLIADGENPEGLTELRAAITEGYSDMDALREFAADEQVSEANRNEILALITETEQAAAKAEKEAAEAEAEAEAEAAGAEAQSEAEAESEEDLEGSADSPQE